MLGLRLVSPLNASDTVGGDLNTFQHQFMGEARRAMAGMVQTLVQDRLIEPCAHPVELWSLSAGQSFHQPLGPIGLGIAADLIGPLPGGLRRDPTDPHDPGGLGEVIQLGAHLQHAELATCYFLVLGHFLLLIDSDPLANSS